MRILIDIGHPAHVHLFKHFAWEMQKKGHKILFTCREKEFEIYLLEKFGFEFKSFGKKYASKIGKLLGLIEFDVKEFLAGMKFKPDLFLSHGSIYAAHASSILGKPHIALEDTGNYEQVRLYLPFTKVVLTADNFPIDYGEKHVRYFGNHEIAYLHPNHFKPDKTIRLKLGLKNIDRVAIVRFVAWNATHDFHKKRLSFHEKLQIIKALENVNYKIFISSEQELPSELIKYKAAFSPDKIHDILYSSDLFIGEGTTMAMEAAILGTPSLYVNTLQYSNCNELATYKLLFNFTSFDGVLEKIKELVELPNLKLEFLERKNRMIMQKIDVTAFLVWFVENYPESFRKMKENPNYQYKFK